MIRRVTCCVLVALLTCATWAAEVRTIEANRSVEWSFTSAKAHADPFNTVELNAVFTTPDGKDLRVPAFWAGGQTWKFRYASHVVGKHAFRTVCSEASSDLHGVDGAVDVTPYTGGNPLYKHGPIRVSSSKRYFEHADGMPFFWLGDTWWMGLCHRLHWPEEFKTLTADRKKKGFNVIQIVAGLYPDMHPFDPRGANEAGFPWEKDYARIRPEYFDAVDRRLMHLVDEGFAPCIVGAWGYYIPWMGVEKAKQHWRYLIARYGALPVVWCAAGEANLNWYLAKPFPVDDRKQVTQWTEVMRYIRATDPFRRPLTIHPTGLGRLSARHATDDESLLDFDLLQTPHGQRDAVEPTVRTVRESSADQPVMPVINGEAAYEMLNDSLPTEWTRRMFWLCMMNGAAGHTYGANGIWQVNRKGQPHGPSPHHAPGSNGYGAIAWDDAMNLPGSTQVAHGAKLFQRFAWHEFEPHPEWVKWDETVDDVDLAWGSWIWFSEGDPARDAPAERRRFRKTIDLPDGKAVKSAVIYLTADDRFTATVNGRQIGANAPLHEAWRRPMQFDIAPLLKTGRNVIEVAAENVAAKVPANPAGLLCAGEIVLDGGTRVRIASDATWEAAKAQAAEWSVAKVIARYGDAPWGKLSATETVFPPLAAGIPRQVRVVYLPHGAPVRVLSLERDVDWLAELFDPVTGQTTELGPAALSDDGTYRVRPPTGVDDWVLVLRKL